MDKKAKVIMVQGTMSNAGKSILAAGLCRIFAKDGFKVAPFKSQNMALNSFVTKEGLEMGRAQVMQAECAGVEPLAIMNPILLKPTSDVGSQVILNGKVLGNMKATEYFKRKPEFIPEIKAAFEQLSQMADIIVVEGAGSPVEMNLKKDDIVNMGLAKLLDAPVLLVGDIDRGGIFPQLLGTLDLLEDDERARVKGLIVNKFRGDSKLFEDGVKILEERGGKKVVGVVPYMNVNLEDEDSLSERFYVNQAKDFDIAVVRLPHISNFTDFDTFEQMPFVSVRYVSSVRDFGNPNVIIIPGSKNTIEDLRWLKSSGLADKIISEEGKGKVIFGICGGYQMLGRKIEDPEGVECGGCEDGLNLLPVETSLKGRKIRSEFTGIVEGATGVLQSLKGKNVEGYEIHMGVTTPVKDESEGTGECPDLTPFTSNATGYSKGNVYGTYVHGFFDKKEILECVTGREVDSAKDFRDFKETQYDILEKGLRESLDLKYIYEIMGIN
ncbi:MAG: cobyric acid synthase [Lachnospiraceae bacterium]|nr:cobyric acid synthase [Lachnospiraceae bacterium]